MKQQDWTWKLRDRMADYEADIPEKLWTRIETTLPRQRVASHRPLIWRWAGVAAMVALLMGAGCWLWPDRHITRQAEHQRPLAGGPQDRTLHASVQPDEGIVPLTAQNRHRRPAVAPYRQPAAEPYRQQEQPHSEDPDRELQPQQPQSAGQPVRLQPSYHPQTSTRQEQNVSLPAAQDGRRERHRDVTLSLHANSGLMAYTHSNGIQMSAEMARRYTTASLPSSHRANADESVWLVGHEERQHHSHPIAVGLTLGYPLSPRLTLSSGLVYTRLSSDFTSIMHQTSIHTDQKLHYLGIPLSLQYYIVKGRRWKAYATAGIEADWNIKSRSVTEGVETQSLRDHLQWSLGGAVGVQYDVLPQLGVYLEPGARYYMDNGSKVQNYFKAHPTTWTLQFGIRLSLVSRDK